MNSAYEGNVILDFELIKKELESNDIFLTIDNRHNGTDKGSFIVCEIKHRSKWRSLISNNEPDCYNPIGSFDTLMEVQAFAIGLCVGKNKAWKYS